MRDIAGYCCRLEFRLKGIAVLRNISLDVALDRHHAIPQAGIERVVLDYPWSRKVAFDRQGSIPGDVEIGAFYGHVARTGGADIESALDGDGTVLGLDRKIVGKLSHKVDLVGAVASKTAERNRTAGNQIDSDGITGDERRRATESGGGAGSAGVGLDVDCLAGEQRGLIVECHAFSHGNCSVERRERRIVAGQKLGRSCRKRTGGGGEKATNIDGGTRVERNSGRVYQPHIHIVRVIEDAAADGRLASADEVVDRSLGRGVCIHVVEVHELAAANIEVVPFANRNP